MPEHRIRRQWRFYVSPDTGRKVAREEFDALPVHGRAALAEAINRWTRGESKAGEVKPVEGSGGLFELRVQVGYDPFRALFFRDSPVHDVCVLVVYKNQRKLPRSDRELACARMKSWKQAGR